MEKLKVAVIGLGNISAEHIRAYISNPQVELYALCSHDMGKARALAQKHGVPHAYCDAKTMFRELPELDAVSICTWNAAHMADAIEALRSGCHVLCEKPMALSADQARHMAQVARENDRLLMIGLVCRFKTISQRLRQMIQEGRLGEIYYGRAQYLRKNGSPGGWFTQKERSGGGPLIDLGVHVIDLARYLCGSPKPVGVYGAVFHQLQESEKVNPEPFDVEDMAVATVRYDNGAVITVETSFSLHTQQDRFCIELYGTKGGGRLSDKLELFQIGTEGCAETITQDPQENPFIEQANHFVDCILSGTKCKASAEDGIIAMQIIDGIYRSAETGHEVILQ